MLIDVSAGEGQWERAAPEADWPGGTCARPLRSSMTQPLRQCVANLAFYESIFEVNAPREILFFKGANFPLPQKGSVNDMPPIAEAGLSPP